MNGVGTSEIESRDQWIEHPHGRLFTRTWALTDLSNAARRAGPLVLLHGSLPVPREQLEMQRFVALGHSVGGAMAIHCAAELSAHCEALITIAAQVFPEDRTLEGIRAAREQFQDPMQVGRLAKSHGDKTRWVLDAWVENWLNSGLASWTLTEILPRVTCPVLAIHGTLDEYGSTRHPDLIGQLSSGPSRVEILPGTGHVPHREQPEIVVNLVTEFVAD